MVPDSRIIRRFTHREYPRVVCMDQEACVPTQPSTSISVSWLCNGDETFVCDTAEQNLSVCCNEESSGCERLRQCEYQF
jgi:hypothetical protein